MYDHVADVNMTTLHEISLQYGLPEFVKTSHISRDVDSLPSSSFADTVKRRFPCHTRADTFLSYAFFLKNAKELEPDNRQSTLTSLRKWANHWAIHRECDDLQRKHEKQSQADLTQLDDEDFAIVESYNGNTYRALPIFDDTCRKEASAHLSKYADRYPMKWRVKAAQRIANRTKDSDESLDEYINKTAGTWPASSESIAKAMFERALFVNRNHKGEPEQIALLKVAQVIATLPNGKLTDKAASVIDKFDTHYGLKRFYARGLPTPEEITHDSTTLEKVSNLREQLVPLTTGSSYTKAALISAGIEPYRALGSDFVNEISNGIATEEVNSDKVAAIVPTLPRDDAIILDRAFSALGVKTATDLYKEANVPEDVSAWTSDDWSRAIEYAQI